MSGRPDPDAVEPGTIEVTFSETTEHVGVDWDGDGMRWLRPDAARDLADAYSDEARAQNLVSTLRRYADKVENR
jgi:hypothetical protein